MTAAVTTAPHSPSTPTAKPASSPGSRRSAGSALSALNATALPYLEPVPASEPPFDDDLPGRRPAVASRWPGTVALRAVAGPPVASALPPVVESLTPVPAFRPAARTGTVVPPSGGSAAVGRRTAIAATGVPPWSSEPDVGVRRTATHELPPAIRSGQVFARALVEVLSGRRPLAQLRVHCAPEIYAGLLERPVPASVCLPHLLNVRVCEPADGAAEVSVVFKRAQRVRAIAFRIQGLDGRWRITALEVG